MKKLLILLTIFFAVSISVHAQNGSRLEALKIAYITKKLNLTPEEAQKFWPVYNQYADEIKAARQSNAGNDEIALEENILRIRKKYNAEFLKALPPEKVNEFFKAEKEFGGFVQKELIQRRQLNQQRRALRE